MTICPTCEKCDTCGKEKCKICVPDSDHSDTDEKRCHSTHQPAVCGTCGLTNCGYDATLKRGHGSCSPAHAKAEERRTYCFGPMCEGTMESCLGHVKPQPPAPADAWEERFLREISESDIFCHFSDDGEYNIYLKEWWDSVGDKGYTFMMNLIRTLPHSAILKERQEAQERMGRVREAIDGAALCGNPKCEADVLAAFDQALEDEEMKKGI